MELIILLKTMDEQTIIKHLLNKNLTDEVLENFWDLFLTKTEHMYISIYCFKCEIVEPDFKINFNEIYKYLDYMVYFKNNLKYLLTNYIEKYNYKKIHKLFGNNLLLVVFDSCKSCKNNKIIEQYFDS